MTREAETWYAAAGSRFIHNGDGRFATMFLKIGNAPTIQCIVHYSPTSGHLPAVRGRNLDKLDDLITASPDDNTLIIFTDANAAIGGRAGDDEPDDGVCGAFGNPHENIAGTALRQVLGLHQLFAPVTYYSQNLLGT